jgi:histidyl-tRNA synthetase
MRPEATAAVVRALIMQHKVYASGPGAASFTRSAPCSGGSGPRKGRYRQFYQINAEIFGVASPIRRCAVDRHAGGHSWDGWGSADARAHVNSLGCPACRPCLSTGVPAGFSRGPVKARLCAGLPAAPGHAIPLRILDCKVHLDAGRPAWNAPGIDVITCAMECKDALRYCLPAGPGRAGGSLCSSTNGLVRGTGLLLPAPRSNCRPTALGAQSAVAGGGRYDGLVKTLGGPPTSRPPVSPSASTAWRRSSASRTHRSRQPVPGRVHRGPGGRAPRQKAFPWLSALEPQPGSGSGNAFRRTRA